LPIKADYVGINIPTARADQVFVDVTEKDGIDRVYVTGDGKPTGRLKAPKKSKTVKTAKSRKGGAK
jgi:hypothetical protein